jgi:hypothetical protein
MAEAMSGPASHCPWCSAPLPDASVERCPSCGAALTASGAEGEIKGVTTLDTEAILRARSEVARPRSRILSFITGEVVPETGDGPGSAESLAPPPDEVRREMLRLQLEAERADLTAETVALKSDELARRGIPLSQLMSDEAVPAEGAEAATPVAGAAAAPSTTTDPSSAGTGLPGPTSLPPATALPPSPGSAAHEATEGRTADDPPAPA